MPQERRYIFGPVPSRRLGLSLGVDVVPHKVCTQDCIYCQIGRTTDSTLVRGDFVPLEELLDELAEVLGVSREAARDNPSLAARGDRSSAATAGQSPAAPAGPRPDYITISGSGEPTLNVRLGEIIAGIRRMTDVPLAIITNGSLLQDPTVRRECAMVDLLVPSLDAGCEETFARLNRPARGLRLADLVAGLVALRSEFRGQYWLEVFIVAGLNDSPREVQLMKEIIDRIRPDRIQINTATRPTAEPEARPATPERLVEIAAAFGPRAEVIASFVERRQSAAADSAAAPLRAAAATAEMVLGLIRRHPATLQETAQGLQADPAEVERLIAGLLKSGQLVATRRGTLTYYEAAENV